MSYKAILFDLDGTLLNTLEDLGNAVNRVLSKNGFPTHRLEAFRYFIGDGVYKLIARALPEDKRDHETIQACLEAYQKDYGQNWNIKTKPYDGVAKMLDGLAARGLKTAVLSNKPHALTIKCVTKLMPEWTFNTVLGERNGVPRKPDPAGALEIARGLNIPPADFLFVGDSAVDMETAIASGMFAVGALWGFRSRDELKASGAQALLERPKDILTLL